ncbi:MAG: hypothetical protein J5845_07895 [Lachnospiraceae bacterium]|nr:hypothetical protein [Lachnospiraceae bacterium]
MRDLRKMCIWFLLLTTAAVLTCCGKKTAGPEASITPEPSVTVMPTESTTPTPTATPIPTPTPSPTPEPTPLASERNVNVKDLLIYENIRNDYFGEPEDFASEMQKRKEYLNSFAILNESETDILLMFMNLNLLAPKPEDSYYHSPESPLNRVYQIGYYESSEESEEPDDSVKAEYLKFYNEKNLKSVAGTVDKIVKYNFDHPDNQLMIGWLAVGDQAMDMKSRIAINDFQKMIYDIATKDITSSRTRIKDIVFYWIEVYYEIYTADDVKYSFSFFLSGTNNVCKYLLTLLASKGLARAANTKKNDSSLKRLASNFSDKSNSTLKPLLNLKRLRENTSGFDGKYYEY